MCFRLTRRDAVKALAAGVGGMSLLTSRESIHAAPSGRELRIELALKYELSPYLFMQFMEPLGVTDSSVEAAWNHQRNKWREDVVETTHDLAPTMLRWGGIFTDFYRWREGVGPRQQRRPMINLMWGGLESNQIGTAEFVDFARRVSAEPLMCVNFESDGRANFKTVNGDIRSGDAREAADWVAYCNDPDNSERRSHGLVDPIPIRYWQLGNETSYDNRGFDLKMATAKTVEFAKAMRAVDRTIRLIAWGDSGWSKTMHDETGELIDMLAFHHMFNPDSRDSKVLEGELYRRDADATWHQLMDAWKIHDQRIRKVRDSLEGRPAKLAMTECHFAIPGRDRCDVMSTWATGVAYARMLNTHQRHGDVLKIATAADFCGTRWQVNAVMIPVPHGKAYLMPVARVMKLYRHHIGTHAVEVAACPADLDVVASRTDENLFLHVVNTNRMRSTAAVLHLPNATIASATAHQIVDDPMIEVSELNSRDVMQNKQSSLTSDGQWSFPAASVTAIEIKLVA
jgi:alpha-N-arabinofuranosidase